MKYKTLTWCLILIFVFSFFTACKEENVEKEQINYEELLSEFVYIKTDTSCEIVAVKNTSATEIVVPDCVTSIHFGAFGYCTNLQKLTLPFVGGTKNANTSTKETTFGYIFGRNGIFDKNIHTIQGWPANYNPVEQYYLPKSLTSVTITSGNLLDRAFISCQKITNITLPNNITHIGDSAFSYCSELTEITLPETVKYIGSFAFSQCHKIKELKIPKSVTTILSNSLDGCGKTFFEDTIQYIDREAFNGTNGPEIYYNGTKEQWKKLVDNDRDYFFETFPIVYCNDGNLDWNNFYE